MPIPFRCKPKPSHKTILCVFLLALAFCSNPLSLKANVLNVPNDYADVNAALQHTSYGDTILIAPGIHHFSFHLEDQNGITVLGADPDSTIIQSSAENAVIVEDANDIVLQDFRIERAEETMGRGLKIDDCDGIVLNNLGLFGHNLDDSSSTHKYGAGAYIQYSEGIISNCTIQGNSLTGTQWRHGAGLYVSYSELEISNTAIHDNHIYGNGWSYGAGVYLNSDLVTFTNCEISSNIIHPQTSWSYGAGVYAQGSFICTNCILKKNTIQVASGWIDGAAIYLDGGPLSLINTVIVKNAIVGSTTGSIIYAEDSPFILSDYKLEIVSSTIANNMGSWRTIRIDDCMDSSIENSILYNPLCTNEIAYPACVAAKEIIFSSLSANVSNTTLDLFNKIGDPLLDFDEDDLPHLAMGSHCIGSAGYGGPTEDLFDTSRGIPNESQPDMGAIENAVDFAEPFLPYIEFSPVYEENCHGAVSLETLVFGYEPTFTWNFGDGTIYSDQNPTHNYSEPGSFTIQGEICDSLGCNSFQQEFTLEDFVLETNIDVPQTGELNVPIQFYNNTENITDVSWVFGDGHISTETNPVHQFTESGTYNIEVVSTNSATLDCTITDYFSILIEGSSNIQELESAWSILPNPCRDFFVISLAPDLLNQEIHYELFTSDAQLALQGSINSSAQYVHTSGLNAGLYMVILRLEDRVIMDKVLVVD